MSFYSENAKKDIITKLRPLLESKGYYLREEDGVIDTRRMISYETPWVHIRHSPNALCHIWHELMFQHFKIIPSLCQDCWKVVVRPKTLSQLFELYYLQKRLDRPSKCGIEVRFTVHGNYGGYFYNKGIKEGLLCYDLVRAEVDKELGKDVSVILKRACTEFELECGPSDKWEVTEEQKETEDYLMDNLNPDLFKRNQPEHLVAHVIQRWIHHAYAIGDATYLEFTDGEPLFKPVVTYHDNKQLRKQILGGK